MTSSTSAYVADSDLDNTASIRAFKKAGFRRVRRLFEIGAESTQFLVRFDRASSSH